MTPSSYQLARALEHLSNTYGSEKVVAPFVRFLELNHLQLLLPQIMQHLQRRSLISQEADTLEVTCATSVSENALDLISDFVHRTTGKVPASVRAQVDPSIVGGFIARYQGRIVDGSINTFLQDTLLTKK